MSKYTGIDAYSGSRKMFRSGNLWIVSSSRPRPDIMRTVADALERGMHVFCEKPFALDPEMGYRLAELAETQAPNQSGRLSLSVRRRVQRGEATARAASLSANASHSREAYGPVVLRPKGSTWRSQKSEGGGCLFDYSCHAIDLVNYLVGRPVAVSGTVLNSVFSSDVDDEIYSTFQFANGA